MNIIEARPDRIVLPQRLATLLAGDREHYGAVLLTLGRFERWMEANRVVFFPEYTDHGPDHVRGVLATATSLIADAAWKLLTPADAATLILSIVLHDCAMHLSEDGFLSLVTGGARPTRRGDAPWPDLWREFLSVASRYDSRKLISLFGTPDPARVPPLDRSELTERDRLLIGEFLRQHHARLADEIAIRGVPGPTPERLAFEKVNPLIADLSGTIARSHGVAIRHALDALPKSARRAPSGIHTAFLMGVLRIADYIQVQAERAPADLLHVRALASPVSRREWSAHAAIVDINCAHDDPESLEITARPENAAEFIHLRNLFASIQRELDETWASLGEIYGPKPELRDLGLIVRRIRTNLDDPKEFAKTVDYVPVHATFRSAGAGLLKLLIRPLYGDHPEIGIRELLQNAVDAVRERDDWQRQNGMAGEPQPDPSVVIRVDDEWLTVQDAGIGMTADVIVNYFLTAGASFRTSEEWYRRHTDASGQPRVLRSGRFGIGALSAFLIGGEMTVTTRHLSAPRGITFTTTLEDDAVDLTAVDAPVGTTVRVRIATPLRNPEEWDWFCTTDLAVHRYQDDELLPQSTTWPGLHEKLPPEWRRLEHPSFDDIHWSYWAGDHQIVCNGISIRRVEDRAVEDAYDGLPSDDGAAAIDPQFSETFVRPALSIFDAMGVLPLTLQRDEVTAFPFRRELLLDIALDALAFLAANAPEDPRRVQSPIVYPAFGTALPWCCAGPKGWYARSLLLPWHAKHVFVIARELVPFVQMPTPEECFVIVTDIRPEYALQLLRPEKGAPRGFPTTDAFWFVAHGEPRARADRVTSLGNVIIASEAAMTPIFGFAAVARERQLSYSAFAAEGLISDPQPDDGNEIAEAWRQVLGTEAYVPYRVSERQHILEHPLLREKVAAHHALLRRLPSTEDPPKRARRRPRRRDRFRVP